MKEPPVILDLSNQDTKRRLMQRISTLSGLYEVLLHPRKKVRSLRQNSYYWVAVVTPFCHWLREQYGDESITIDEAHELLKRRVLKPREGVNQHTGEVIKLARTTTTLTTAEFSEYVEKAAHFLADFAGIVVLPPDAYFEKPSTDIAKVKSRVRNLLAVASDDAASEGKAENAMGHAKNLMETHGLKSEEFKAA